MWPLLAALTPPLMFPFTKESSPVGSTPILSSTHSGYQLLISAFNHFPNPHKMGPIFQNQNQRSKDNKVKWKNKSLRSISYLGKCFLFSYDHFLENPYWSGPALPHPSGPRWRQEEDWFIPPHLFPVLRRAVLCSNADNQV